MNKKFVFGLLVALLVVMFTSCTTATVALGSAVETKGETYVLQKSDDINGHHEVEAILVDKQSKGLATEFYDVRFLRMLTNSVVNDYAIQFRRTLPRGNLKSFELSTWDLDKVIKIDDVPYLLTDSVTIQDDINLNGVSHSNMEFRLNAEIVNALKKANTIKVQYFKYNNKPVVVDIDPKYMEAIRDFFN